MYKKTLKKHKQTNKQIYKGVEALSVQSKLLDNSCNLFQ